MQFVALVLEVEAHQQAIGDLEAKFKEQEAAVQEMQQGLVDCGKQANVLINKKQALEASLSQMSIKRQDVQSRYNIEVIFILFVHLMQEQGDCYCLANRVSPRELD